MSRRRRGTIYDKMVIVDLEATCWKGRPPSGQQAEIIEFGVSTLNLKSGEITVLPDMFVRPTQSDISEFCTELTSITPEMVDGAPTLEERLEELWPTFSHRIFGCWGEYDHRQIDRESRRKSIDFRLPRTRVNLKSEFARYMGLQREIGVEEALNRLGLTFDPPPGAEAGTAHRGSHDSYNIARIAKAIMSGSYSGRFTA